MRKPTIKGTKWTKVVLTPFYRVNRNKYLVERLVFDPAWTGPAKVSKIILYVRWNAKKNGREKRRSRGGNHDRKKTIRLQRVTVKILKETCPAPPHTQVYSLAGTGHFEASKCIIHDLIPNKKDKENTDKRENTAWRLSQHRATSPLAHTLQVRDESMRSPG